MFDGWVDMVFVLKFKSSELQFPFVNWNNNENNCWMHQGLNLTLESVNNIYIKYKKRQQHIKGYVMMLFLTFMK